MRADRLLSLVMLLQTRGNMTAQALGEELEVSERTIYRDVEALSFAGIPVYTERGPGGGIALLDSYRTSLTGLNRNEVRALFMLSIPAPLDELGVTADLKAALLKLSAALPAVGRDEQIMARQRIHLESVAWSQPEQPVPHLQTIHQAVWQDFKLQLRYDLGYFGEIELPVDPYGLVAKTTVWYLVCAREDHLRVLRVPDILEARVLDEHFERPTDFELEAYWQTWSEQNEERLVSFRVKVRVNPDLNPYLWTHFGERVADRDTQVEVPDEDGWITLTLLFERFEEARRRLLGYGRAIEVLEPDVLRKSIKDYAWQVVDLYSEK
ncbi:MAG: WYL domain-containing protein [Anaerolineales bacterium]|nr:WYL domain-containing protein [Anaerolineales bacterium]